MEYNPKDPRNLLAELLNKHLPDAIQIPKLSVEDRQKFMDETLSPEGMTLGMGLGGIGSKLGKDAVKAVENQKAVYDFNKLKKSIQERGYGKQMTDEELFKSYNKQASPEQLKYAEELRKSDKLQNLYEQHNLEMNNMPNPIANDITKLIKAN